MKLVLSALLIPALSAAAFAGDLEKAYTSAAAAFSPALVQAQALPAKKKETPAETRQKLLNERLVSACHGSDLDEIKRLVAMGANPNAYDGLGFTPLASAAMSMTGDTAVLELLINLGAKVNFKGTCDVTALHMAASYGNLDGVKLLLAKGAKLESKDCVGATPLVEAIGSFKLETFKHLLALGANPNATDLRKETPLIMAAGSMYEPKDNEYLQLLLADPRTNLNAVSEEGETALKIAVKGNNVELVKLLLAQPKIDVNVEGGGTTALFLAELGRFDEIAGLLRAAGAKSLHH